MTHPDKNETNVGLGRRVRPVTLEELWARHGASIRATVARRLGDDPRAIEVACCETMVRAATRLGASRLDDPSGLLEALGGLAGEVCEDLLRGLTHVPERPKPMPAAIPVVLRAHFHQRALRAWSEAELLSDAPAVAALGSPLARLRAAVRAHVERSRSGAAVLVGLRSLQVAANRRARGVRAAARRAEAGIAPVANETGYRFAALLAETPALGQAAAVAAAVVGIGLGATPPAPMPADVPTRPVLAAASTRADTPPPSLAGASPVETSARELPGQSSPEPSQPVAHRPEATEGPEPIVSASPVPAPAIEPAEPQVQADSDGAEEDPVRRRSEDGWTITETPDPGVAADVDGDGDDEVSAGATVFFDCPPPDERGPVSSLACDASQELPG